MASLDWDRYATLGLATFAVALTAFIGSWKLQQPGARMSWQSAALLAISAAFLCATLVLAWLAAARHPNRLIRRAVRHKAAERERATEVACELRGGTFDAVRSWDRFSGKADAFLATYYAPDEESQEWRERLRLQWEDAVRAAHLLTRGPQERAAALQRIAVFKALVDGSEQQGAFRVDAIDLKNFLFEASMYYRKLKEDARVVERKS